MRKLWNHYDPIDLNQTADEPGDAPQPAQEPPAKKSFGQKLESFFFRVEEEEDGTDPAYAGETAPLPEMKKERLLRQQEVQKALEEWKAAAAYFESVADPELVDYAVYGMEAAQKRYIYLLRTAGHK